MTLLFLQGRYFWPVLYHYGLVCHPCKMKEPHFARWSGISTLQWYSSRQYPSYHVVCFMLQGGFGVFVVYDLEKPFPTACKTVPETHFRGKKRKRSTSMAEEKDQDQANESSAIVCLRYNSMLHLGFLEEDEMIIVEEPWLNIVGTFPAALARRIYGT